MRKDMWNYIWSIKRTGNNKIFEHVFDWSAMMPSHSYYDIWRLFATVNLLFNQYTYSIAKQKLIFSNYYGIGKNELV